MEWRGRGGCNEETRGGGPVGWAERSMALQPEQDDHAGEVLSRIIESRARRVSCLHSSRWRSC